MKAISLWQPWATLMAVDAKRNETRGRPWAHVGDVAICAAKLQWRSDVPQFAIPALKRLWEFREQVGGYASDIHDLYMALPFGKVVCVVEKTGCISTNDDNGDDRSLTPLELDLGDYSANRFYYPTRHCRRLESPVTVRAGQFVFELPPEVERRVQELLARINTRA